MKKVALVLVGVILFAIAYYVYPAFISPRQVPAPVWNHTCPPGTVINSTNSGCTALER